jgi:hypothetical protein
LDYFAIDAKILYFCEIDFVTTFNSANKAHSVHIIHYKRRKTSNFLGSSSVRINRLHQGFKRILEKYRWCSVQERGRIQVTGAQLEAILAHEMCHVRRRDNLTFALHMLVETLFWFHPLVWWIQGRLVEERELACDEAVLQSGNEAEVYAEGILKVCKFYVESPLACAAGVSGADLKKRVARIMTEQMGRNLSWAQKLVLCIAGLVAVMMPVAFGLSHAGVGKTEFQDNPKDVKLPAFEVASIKPNKASDDRMMFMMTPDGLSATGTPMV